MGDIDQTNRQRLAPAAADDHAARRKAPNAKRLPRAVSGALLALAVLTGSATAAFAEPWTVTLTPYVWLQGTTGNIKVRGIETRIDNSFFDIVKGTDTVLGGFVHLEARQGVWGFYLEGNYAYTSTEGRTGFGASTDISTGLTIVEAGGLLTLAKGSDGAGSMFSSWRLEGLAGLRYVSFTAEAEIGPISAKRTVDWVDPLIGLNAIADLSPRWTVIAHADIGGFGIGSDLTSNLYGLLGYRSTVFGASVLSTIGYRGLYIDRSRSSRDSTELWLHGPVLGLTFRL